MIIGHIPPRYGPHRPEDQPATVTVGHPDSRRFKEREARIHPDIVRQREQLNTIAHRKKDPCPPS